MHRISKRVVTIIVVTICILVSIEASRWLGRGSAHKKLIDSDGNKIDSVCVVPLYEKESGISYGPDGKGGEVYPGFILKKPYLFEYGENFNGDVLPTKRMIIPFFAFGEGYTPIRFMLIKNGYTPLLLNTGGVFNNDSPIEMSKSKPSGMEAEIFVSWLIDNKAKQQELLRAFELSRPPYYSDSEAALQLFIHAELSANDKKFLRKCVGRSVQ